MVHVCEACAGLGCAKCRRGLIWAPGSEDLQRQVAALKAEGRRPHPRPRWESRRVTAREREVLAGLADGLSDRMIARRLFISENTVKNHLTTLRRKVGVHNRAALVAFALRSGLIV